MPFALEPPRRIGWALVIAAMAETIVAVAAILTGAYIIGFLSVFAMSVCGMVLVVAEAISSRGGGR